MNIEEKIQDLRKQWLANPDKRKIIELQVRILKVGAKAGKSTEEKAKQIGLIE